MRKESTNRRNGFLIEKPCLLFNQCTRNHEFGIGKKPPVFIEIMQCSSLVKLGERRRKQLLLEDTTTVERSFYR
jgi:hypothetical protein